MKKILIPAAAAAILLGAWAALHGAPVQPAPPTADAALVAADTAAATTAAPDAAPPTAATMPMPVAAERQPIAIAEPSGRLAVAVAWHDGTPAQDVGVRAFATANAAIEQDVRTDAEGRATIRGLPAGEYTVQLDRGAVRTAHVAAGLEAPCRFELARGVRVEGTVTTLDDEPVAGAAITTMAAGHEGLAYVLAMTAADGTFVVRDVPPGTMLLARKDGWQPSADRHGEVRGRAGATERLNLKLGARAFALRGRVELPDGRPAAFAQVVVAVDEDCRKRIDGLAAVRAADGNGRLDREAVVLRCDGEGRFASAEVPWGDAVVFARGSGPADELVGAAAAPVRPTGQDEVLVRLARGGELRGTVRDAAGQAFGGARLLAMHDGDALLGEVDKSHFAALVLDRRAVAAADGTFRIGGLWPADYHLRRELPDRTERLQRVTLGAGESAHVDVVVARTWDLRVVVRDAAGAPLPGWCVMATERGDIAFARADGCVTDNDGIFTARDLDADELWLCVHAPTPGAREPFARLPAFAQQVRRGEREVTAIVRAPTASVAARVLGADGAPRADCRGELKRSTPAATVRATTDADGRAECSALPGGDYVLAFRSNGLQVERDVHLDDGQHVDLGDLLLPAAGRIECEVTLDGAPVRAKVHLRPVAPPDAGPGAEPAAATQLELREDAGRWRSEDLPCGSYLVAVTGDEFAPALQAVEVRPGATQRVAVACERGVPQQFVVVLSDATSIARGQGYAWLTIRAGDRTLLVDHYASGKLPDPTRPEVTTTVRLVPGTYTALARGRTGGATQEFAVAAGGPAVRIVLR